MEDQKQPNGIPTEEDLALIHRYTRAQLAAQEVYVFQTVLCDNEIDRDGEQFPLASLQTLAELFPGKTGLFDHSGKSGDQVMRIYAAAVELQPERLNSAGEPYAALTGKVYLLRTEENAALIREIEGGIKKEVSVSCAVRRVRCSVCGETLRSCGHRKGESYEGRRCWAILEEPTDAYEFSFVAIPAQPGAGVIKRKKGRGGADAARLAELERLAEDGRAYRAELLAKTLRAGGAALPELDRDLLEGMCAHLEARQLAQLRETLETCAAKSLPLRPQLNARGPQGEYDGYRF
ncbi:MAG: hypothetical protein LBG83_06980 [Oscillospiraceae bacterium]|jgi:hypothetical protein|nr:hypothetical protein [Oscillospiraceae bacterium]